MPLDDELTKFLSGIVRPKPSGDRITDQLKTRSGQPIGFGEVISRSINTGQGFGESLNAIKAKALAVDAAEQDIDITERAQSLAEQEFDFKRGKFLFETSDANAKAFEDRFKFWSEGLSKQDQVKLYDYARDHTENVSADNVDTILSSGIREHELKKPVTPHKESMTPIKVADQKSGTGFFWLVPATGKIIGEAPPTGGLKAKYNPKTGEFEISTGPDMATRTKADLEEKILSASDALVGIRDIKSSFEPDFQTLKTRWNFLIGEAQEKAKGIPPLEWIGEQFGEIDRDLIRQFAVYRRRSFSYMNRVIKDMTGTAVSKEEAERLKEQLPNPGTGLFDGDSPTAFYAKLIDVEREVKRVVARYNYALRNGVTPMSIDLFEIERIMEKRWDDIFKSLPEGKDEVEKASEATRILKEEFGI